MSNIKNYRKKPIVIQALQYYGQNIEHFVPSNIFYFQEEIDPSTYNVTRILRLKTLEGDHIVSLNDYIIKGIKGEFYPCKTDIFEASYDLAD